MSVKLTDEEGAAAVGRTECAAQIRAALAAVSERSSFGATGVLAKRDLGSERPTLMAFLEYIYFASPSFLSSVGEADLGGSNDGR